MTKQHLGAGARQVETEEVAASVIAEGEHMLGPVFVAEVTGAQRVVDRDDGAGVCVDDSRGLQPSRKRRRPVEARQCDAEALRETWDLPLRRD